MQEVDICVNEVRPELAQYFIDSFPIKDFEKFADFVFLAMGFYHETDFPYES